MTDLRLMICDLAREFEAEDNCASDLWSWLPSHKYATDFHGSYACEFRPKTKDLMTEASLVFSILKGREKTEVEMKEWFRCPCDDPHEHDDPKRHWPRHLSPSSS